LARTLVELHHGTIEARSDGVDRGSEFIVRLPIATPGVAIDSPQSAPRRTASSSAPTRVLVVDDHRDALDAMVMLLSMEGHEVYTAATGEEAVEKTGSLQPDVVLLDIGLPGISGYEAAQRIRRSPAGSAVKLIAMTGWGQEEDK